MMNSLLFTVFELEIVFNFSLTKLNEMNLKGECYIKSTMGVDFGLSPSDRLFDR